MSIYIAHRRKSNAFNETGNFFRKLTLTHIPDLNRYQFVHVNDRSLYINWRMMVVVEENVLYHVKRKGELSERGKSPGEIYPRGKCPGGMSRSLTITRPIYSVQGYASQQAKL